MGRPAKIPCLLIACLLAALAGPSTAGDHVVSDRGALQKALKEARPGDRIVLQPGTYRGGLRAVGLTGVTITSTSPGLKAVISGGTNALQLSSPRDVTIESIECVGQGGNGLNIDDGGSRDTPARNVTIRNVTVRNVASGNRDGIKLSGVTGFLVDGVRVENWGDGGSAIDMVGCHDGVIRRSLLRHTKGRATISGIRPKGGCKNIVVRANRIELHGGVGRALQAGGVTEPKFFRFLGGDSGYEADEIVFEGNVVVGSSAPFSFVNIDGGLFHHNAVFRPRDWIVRILNENQKRRDMVQTQNGMLAHNLIVYSDTDEEIEEAVNIGPGTLPETLRFVGNRWFDRAKPSAGPLALPVEEVDGVRGTKPGVGPDEPIAWEFEWGLWIVNAVDRANEFALDEEGLELAMPGLGARFEPLEPDPFVGSWTYRPWTADKVPMRPLSEAHLRRKSR